MRKATQRNTFEKALKLDPNLRLAHLDLGIIYAARNDGHAAVRHFKEAIRIDPSQADAHYRLGRVWMSLGRTQDAESEFAKVKALAKTEAPPEPLVKVSKTAQ